VTTEPTLCETRATAEADPTLKSGLHPGAYVISWAAPANIPDVLRSSPLSPLFPPPRSGFFFFFFFFLPSLSVVASVVFPGRSFMPRG
jgi:hypothetical protein